VTGYAFRVLVCLLGCVVLGFGVFLEVKAKLTYLAGEGLALAISERFPIEFGKGKIGVDTTLVLFGMASSFVFLHDLQGIREGSIVAAFLVGLVARFFSRRMHFVDAFLADGDSVPEIEAEESEIGTPDMAMNVPREFG